MVTKPRRSGKLKLIFHLKEPVVSDEGIDIIIIPAASSQYTTEQRRQSCSWLKPLVAATQNDTRVLFFSYELDIDGTSFWQQLLDQSHTLLEAIFNSRRAAETQQRPLMFICHSLGGIILKHALCIAHQQANRDILLEDVTSGIIFLGTPHTTSKDNKRWENWRWILKLTRKDIAKQSQTEEDINMLVEVCQNFERLNLQIPVLSVFEAKETRVRDGLLQSIRNINKSQILVDEELCRTGLKYEQIFPADSDHNQLWLVEVDSLFYKRLVKFFKSIAEEAPGNVALLFGKLHFNDTSTLRTATSIYSGEGVDTPTSDSKGTNMVSGAKSDQPTSTTPIVISDFDLPIRGGKIPAYLTNGLSRNSEFYGRQDILKQMDETFLTPSTGLPSKDGLRSFVICGMGGLGKTEVAIEYMFSRKDKFDAIFWVSADTTQKLNLGFAQISRALGLENSSDVQQDEIASREIVKGWLLKPIIAANQGTPKADVEASWLIIFDNVDDPDTMYDFWPLTGVGSMIITSRNPLALDSVYSPTVGVNLSPFNLAEAGPFLRKLSQREFEKNSLDSCTKIVELLGGLPLAITQMGGIIRRRHLSLEDFLIYYAKNAKRLHEMQVPGQNPTYNQTVSSVWMLDALSKEATALLQVLSFLDPDRISEEILFGNTKDVNIPHYPKTRVAYFDARTELIQSSLIFRDIKNNELRIHRLVQDVVRKRLTDEESYIAFDSITALISNCWPFIKFDERNMVNRLTKCESLFPHVERIRVLFEDAIRSRVFKPNNRCAALFNEVAWYRLERAYDDEAGIYASLSLEILHQVPKEDIEKNLELSKMLSESHQYRAVSLLFTDTPGSLDEVKAMIDLVIDRIKKWNRGEDAIQLAESYNVHGMALTRSKEDDKAIESWWKSYEAFGNISSGNKLLRQEWPAIHLAIIYSLRKEAKKGEDILLPVLKAREEAFGKDDKTSMVTGKALHALGDVRLSQGSLDEALDLFQRALVIFRATIGDNHFITADTCYRLAEQFIRIDKNHEANQLLEQSIKVYRDIRWYKPQAARSSFMKGRLLNAMGNFVEGDAQLKRAMDLRREIVPHDHRTVDQLTDEDFDKLVWYYSR